MPLGAGHLPMRTIGLTAKERERARLQVSARPRPTADRPRVRTRGAGRPKAQSSRSSSRSGDSGEDGEGPPAAEPCSNGCGRPRRAELEPPHRYYCTDECRREHQRARQNESRDRDRARRAAERPGVDRHRRDPYEQLAPHEYEALRKRVNDGCDCNGTRLLLDSPDHCSWCGHETGDSALLSQA